MSSSDNYVPVVEPSGSEFPGTSQQDQHIRPRRTYGKGACSGHPLSIVLLFLCALLALHASTGVWIGVWDNLTYFGLGYKLCLEDEISGNKCEGSPLRDVVMMIIGGLGQFVLGTFVEANDIDAPYAILHTEAFWQRKMNVDWEGSLPLGFPGCVGTGWIWFRVIGSYVCGLLVTAGLYDLIDHYNNKDPWVVRDITYFLVGVAGCSIIHALERKKVFSLRGPPLSQAPPRMASRKAGVGKSNRISELNTRGVHVNENKLLYVFLACLHLLFQVLTWIGCDHWTQEWCFGGVQYNETDGQAGPVPGRTTCFGTDTKEWYHYFVFMAIGIVMMLLSGLWPSLAQVHGDPNWEDEITQSILSRQPAGVKSKRKKRKSDMGSLMTDELYTSDDDGTLSVSGVSLPGLYRRRKCCSHNTDVSRGGCMGCVRRDGTWRSVIGFFGCYVVGYAGYFIHLSGFWYLLADTYDDKTWVISLLCLPLLYLSGALFLEGSVDVPPTGLLHFLHH